MNFAKKREEEIKKNEETEEYKTFDRLRKNSKNIRNLKKTSMTSKIEMSGIIQKAGGNSSSVYSRELWEKKKLILIHLNGLHLGGTEEYVQYLCKYLQKLTDKYIFAVITFSHSDMTRKFLFEEILGKKLILAGSIPEYIEIVKKLQPAILHMFNAGIAEFPLVNGIKDILPNTKFVQTSVFGNQNDQLELNAVIYVSRWIQQMVGKIETKNHYVVRNPVEKPLKWEEDNKKECFGIPKDNFVFGHIGRPDVNTYDNLNLQAYAKIETDKTYFVVMGVDELAKEHFEKLGIKRYKLIPKSVEWFKISMFYRMIDVLAHSRADGECNSSAIFAAQSIGKPVISHYGKYFNGHIETIQNSGVVVNAGDVNEYARIMKNFVDQKIDYQYFSDNAKKLWEKMANPVERAKEQLEIYEEILG